MKKKYIQLGAVAILLIAMIAVLVILRNAPAPSSDEPSSSSSAEAVFVIGGDEAAATLQIDIEGEETGTFSIISDVRGDAAPGYTIKGWEELSLDSYALASAASNASAMTAKIIVAENADSEKLKEYGLDKPRSTAQIKYADNTGATVLFGGIAPSGEGVYVCRDGDNTVYLLSPQVAEPFLMPDVAYINKTVTEADAESKSFDKLILTGTDYPEPIVIERSPETTQEISNMLLGTHRISSPLNAGISSISLEPLATIYGLAATDVVVVDDSAATLEKYGLKEPAAVAAVTGPDPQLTFTLKISKPDDDGNIYFSKNGSPVIYQAPASIMPWLGMTLFDFMEKMAILPPIDSISQVKVTIPGKTYLFKLDGEGDELVVMLNGKKLPNVIKANGDKATGASNFRQYYQSLISASYTEETQEQPPEDAVPVLQFEYSYRDGKNPDVVNFYTGPTRRAFMSLNGGAAYFTHSVYVDRIIEDSAKIERGEAIKSYL